jgi:DNA-binding response OmpR family regulator
VDDDPQFIRLLERILRNQFVLETASSGAEALLITRAFQPDLILLDINMSGMDGYETCRRLRQNERSRLFKIFMVSAKDKLDDRLVGYEAGADDYVTKPFDPEELLAKIHVFMKLRRTEEVDGLKNSLLELLASEVLDPVKKIMDWTGELINNPETPDHLWELLSSVYKNAIDLNRFVGKADRLHRLRQQGIELHYSRDSLKAHLLSTIRQWTPAAQQKGLRVVYDISGDNDISMDWDVLDEVINYLLDNAVRYSEDRFDRCLTRKTRPSPKVVGF